eukprot:jgi/Bigna1/79469/fgenesh1_pg.62_\
MLLLLLLLLLLMMMMMRQFGGYCYLNNACIAAKELQSRGMKKIGILDVDYHHGDGTQSVFWDDDSVFTVSLHMDPRFDYPHFSGFKDERGAGKGFLVMAESDGKVGDSTPRGVEKDWKKRQVTKHRALAAKACGNLNIPLPKKVKWLSTSASSPRTDKPNGSSKQNAGSVEKEGGVNSGRIAEGGGGGDTNDISYREALLGALQQMRRFEPDVVIVSFGADTVKGDPDSIDSAGMALEVDDFKEMGNLIRSFFLPCGDRSGDASRANCNGESEVNACSNSSDVPLLVVQEGGYHMDVVDTIAHNFLLG